MLNFYKVAKSKKELAKLNNEKTIEVINTYQSLCVYVEKASKIQVDLITKKV